jgi:hypothetical protein
LKERWQHPKKTGRGGTFFLSKYASKYTIKAIPNCNCESHQTYLTRIIHKGRANGGHPNT